MRVALDLTPLIGSPTGIHQVTRGLLDALTDRDDVAVHGWLLTARGTPPTAEVSVRRSRVPASLAIRGWAHLDMPPGRLVCGTADVVHGTNFLAPPRPDSVISLQDMTPVIHPEWCEPAVAAMAGAIRNAVRRGATLHTSSELVRQEALAEFALAGDRVRLVHHAVAPLVGGDAEEGRRLAGGRYVLVLGRTEKRKNVVAAIEALHELPDDVRLVIAGPDGNDAPRIDAATARHSPGRIVRLPRVSDHHRAALVAGAEALLWPSRYEGFALPPLEALSIGTPVVATAVGALPELVGDAVELLAPGDDDAFAHAVVAAVEHPSAVTSELRARITAHTWADAAAGMVDIYADVARS
ncbi:MAG: glycosyltransferase family 1 protein [Acidimicrobiales bacterium]